MIVTDGIDVIFEVAQCRLEVYYQREIINCLLRDNKTISKTLSKACFANALKRLETNYPNFVRKYGDKLNLLASELCAI